MNKSTIQTLIDKVIGKKGLIRVPSWWMRKVLMQMADWVQEGDDANGEKIVKVKEEGDAKIGTLETNVNTLETNLNSEISYLKNLSLPYMLVSGTGIVNIDGNEVSFTDTDKQLIYITGTINFKKQGSSKNNQIIYTYIPHLDIRSQGRDMSNMFYSCSGLTSLDLTGFNTSAVTNMVYMFRNCSGLTSLDLTGFNTSAVTNMGEMFRNCSGLTSLDLTGFDTSAVTNMGNIFSGCSGLTSLILGPNFFKTPNVAMVNFSYSPKWINDTVVTSLVTNSYDRATAGLRTMMLQLSTNTKAALTDEQKAAITAKGYTIA